MRKIVNRLLYNTARAEKLAHRFYYDVFKGPKNDEDYGESLYRTQNGRYFIYGIGGSLSPYRCSGSVCPKSQLWGRTVWEDIIPVSEEEALEWLISGQEINLVLHFFKEWIKPA